MRIFGLKEDQGIMLTTAGVLRSNMKMEFYYKDIWVKNEMFVTEISSAHEGRRAKLI